MTHPNLAIGLIHPGEWSSTFGESIVDLMLYEAARTGMPPYLLSNRCSSGRLVEGRNEVVTSFLAQTKAEWLLFIDADMGFKPTMAEHLLRSAGQDKPIVGGLCFGQRRVGVDPDTHAQHFVAFPTIYQWREWADRVGFEVIADYPMDQLALVGATGAACILIKRTALTEIQSKFGDKWFDQVVHPTGPTTFSEDMSFCIRAQACDLPVYVDTRVKTCHDKGGIFLDEAAWLADKATVAEPMPVAV